MAYVKVNDNGSITAPYRKPDILQDSSGDTDLRSLTREELETHGIFWIEPIPKPADTATTTHDRSIELVDDAPVMVWTPRALTQAEIDAATEAAEDDAEEAQVRAMYHDLKDTAASGAMTGGERLRRLERVAAYVLKNL